MCWKSVWICVGCAVNLCLIGPVTLCSSPAPGSLSWKFAGFPAFPSVLVNGVPIFRFHASLWACLLSVGARGTSCTEVTSTFAALLASVLAGSSCRQHHLLPSLLSWTMAGAFPWASGSAEGSLRSVLALGHENSTVREKDKQRAGYQKVM